MKYILILVLFFSSVYADRDGGPYIGVGYGTSKYSSDGLYETLKEDSSNAVNIYGGAYINKHLSVELGYVDFTPYGMGDGYQVDETKFLDYSLFTISTLAHYAFFDDILDFYARFGAGQINLDGESGFTFIFGVGTAIRFNEYFSLKFAYDRYEFDYDTNNDNSADYMMAIDYIYSAFEVQF